jgi:hypothetical protein
MHSVEGDTALEVGGDDAMAPKTVKGPPDSKAEAKAEHETESN